MEYYKTLEIYGAAQTVKGICVSSLQNISRTSNANDLGYKLFCTKKGEVDSWQLTSLPTTTPHFCAAALRKHYVQANYQAGVWKLCLERRSIPSIPSPAALSWCTEQINGKFELAID